MQRLHQLGYALSSSPGPAAAPGAAAYLRGGPVVRGYEMGPVIGIGTYGEVRCARNTATNQRVAVKIVDLSRFREETDALMSKEIGFLRLVEHRHCIRLREVLHRVPYRGSWCAGCACTEFAPLLGTHECVNCGHSGHDHSGEEVREVMFVLQELAAGGELFSMVMHGGRFDEPVARHYFAQILDGLQYLHGRGVVHRDVKPENLVFDASFDLKIVDFGLAAFSSGGGGGGGPALHSGVGSLPYTAPEAYYCKELHAAEGYRGEPADLWSAAVVLFVMLAGRPPFVRPLAKTRGPDMRRCRHFINLQKGQGFGDMSAEARDLIMSALRPDPAERATLAELRAHPWMAGPTPDPEELGKLMEEKATGVWMSLQKPQMVGVLTKLHRDMDVTPHLKSVREPFGAASLPPLSLAGDLGGASAVPSPEASPLDTAGGTAFFESLEASCGPKAAGGPPSPRAGLSAAPPGAEPAAASPDGGGESGGGTPILFRSLSRHSSSSDRPAPSPAPSPSPPPAQQDGRVAAPVPVDPAAASRNRGALLSSVEGERAGGRRRGETPSPPGELAARRCGEDESKPAQHRRATATTPERRVSPPPPPSAEPPATATQAAARTTTATTAANTRATATATTTTSTRRTNRAQACGVPAGEPAMNMRSRLECDLVITRLCETLAVSGLEYGLDDTETEVRVGGVFLAASMSCLIRVSPAYDEARGAVDSVVQMWRLAGDPRAFQSLFQRLSRSIEALL